MLISRQHWTHAINPIPSLEMEAKFPVQSENGIVCFFFFLLFFFLSLVRIYYIFYLSWNLNRSCKRYMSHKHTVILGTLNEKGIHMNMLLSANGSNSFSAYKHSISFFFFLLCELLGNQEQRLIWKIRGNSA